MRFYKLLLGSKNTTFSVTRNNGCLSTKCHFSTEAGIRLNHHGNFKVQRFQLFEWIKKDECTPGLSVTHLPLPMLYNAYTYAGVPIGHSVTLKESYSTVETMLQKLCYNEHKWLICVDLKMVNLLLKMVNLFMKMVNLLRNFAVSVWSMACQATTLSHFT